jgi:toxin ParE1/3/4
MKPWKVILTDTALADLDRILETTLEEFGTIQFKRYTEQIESAIRKREESGNRAPLLKPRSDIRPGISTFPLSRKGRDSPHQFYLRMKTGEQKPAVIRGNTTSSSLSCQGGNLIMACRNTGCSSQSLSHFCKFG